MKRILLLAALALAAPAPSAGQTRRPARPSTRATPEQQVRQFERDFIEARRQARRGNTLPLERLLADDFIATSLNGRVVDRAGYIRSSRNPNLRFSSFNVDDTSIRVYGDTAVADGRVTLTSRVEEGTRKFQFRYTHLYVGGAGRWRIAASHLTPVASADAR